MHSEYWCGKMRASNSRLMWLGMGTSRWVQYRNFGLHNMQEISELFEKLLAFQDL